MANKKINELTAETTLSDNNLFITQIGSDETKSVTLSLLKEWLDMLTFDDVANYFTEGSNITITVNSETNQIEITSTAEKGDKGDKGEDGYSPSVKVEESLTGAIITIVDKTGTTIAEIYNGKNGEIKEWFPDTSYVVDDIVVVETVLYRCHTEHISEAEFSPINWTALTGVQGEQGVTPHIDVSTKHWFIGNTDTGVLAEGITTVTTTAVVYTGTLSADSWIGDIAPYTQTVTMADIDETSRPYLYPVLSDVVETGLEQQKQWGYITKAVTSADTITFSCYKTKPTIDINFEAEVR